MSTVQHTLRLPLALDKTLRHYATIRETTPYALLQLCVRTGLTSLCEAHGTEPLLKEMAQELGSLSARLIQVERLAERALYVSCAAYVYARAGAASAYPDERQLTEDIAAAFQRQLSLAGAAS